MSAKIFTYGYRDKHSQGENSIGILFKQNRRKEKGSYLQLNLSVQSLASEVGKHEASAVDILVVVAAQTLLLLAGPGADGLLEVARAVLAADHEADLAGGVGGDGGVGVFGGGEDLLAGLLEVCDQRKVKPLVLGCNGEKTNPNRSRKAGGLRRDSVSLGTLYQKDYIRDKGIGG